MWNPLKPFFISPIVKPGFFVFIVNTCCASIPFHRFETTTTVVEYYITVAYDYLINMNLWYNQNCFQIQYFWLSNGIWTYSSYKCHNVHCTYLLCIMLFTTLYLVTYLAIMRLIGESFQSGYINILELMICIIFTNDYHLHDYILMPCCELYIYI